MKRIMILSCYLTLTYLQVNAQDVPFAIDNGFVATQEYIQKNWTGGYEGVDPNSREKLTISRTLVLRTDMTYTNETTGHTEKMPEDNVLRHEEGGYVFNSDEQQVIFTVKKDSALNLATFFRSNQVKYIVNEYDDTATENVSAEKAQFTFADADGERQWVVFDNRLKSTINPQRDAVYLMQEEKISDGIEIATDDTRQRTTGIYNLQGMKIRHPHKGIYILNGKKTYITK